LIPPRTWNFGVTDIGAAYFSKNGLAFDTAIFAAKDHKDTTAPLVFSLYSGLGGNINGNTLLARISLPASDFNQNYSDGEDNRFKFTPKMLTKGYYSVTLTTTAPNNSTQDYFLKQGTLSLQNLDGVDFSADYWLKDKGTGNATGTFNGSGSIDNIHLDVAAPEPSTLFAMIIFSGVILVGGLKKK